MSPSENDGPMTAGEDALLRRVVSILEQVRQNVVRSVNSNMVVAYWLIGREIVEGVQEGEERAEYGKKVPTASPDAWRNATARGSHREISGIFANFTRYLRIASRFGTVRFHIGRGQFRSDSEPGGFQIRCFWIVGAASTFTAE